MYIQIKHIKKMYLNIHTDTHTCISLFRKVTFSLS